MNTSEKSIETFEFPPPPLVSGQPNVARQPPSQGVHPDNPPWGIWQALLTWALSMLLLVLVPAVFTLPYVLYRYPGVPITQELLIQDKTLLFISLLCFVPVHLLTFLLVWAVVTQMRRYAFWTTIGWGWPANLGPWKSAGLAVLLFGMALVITGLFPGKETDVERIVQSSRAAAYTLAIIAVASAPLVEELVYRGVLYPAFQRTIGMKGAVVVVAGLFAVGHIYQYRHNLGVIAAIVLLSVVLTLVRARTGRLLPCFIIHLVFNGIQSVGIVVAPYLRGPDSGGEQQAASLLMVFRVLLRVV